MTSELLWPFPRHVLCFIGSGMDFGEVAEIAAEVGGPGFELDDEYSQAEPDPNMAVAFSACLTNPSFTEADTAAVESHDSVAYVLSPPILPGLGTAVSARALAVMAALLESVATAAKNESTGLTHGRDRWLELAAGAAEADDEVRAVALYRAWVKRPIRSGSVLYSCGMHLLGHPDLELEAGDDGRLQGHVDTLDALGLYLLTEERAAELADGSGFRVAADAPRWLVRERDCDRYGSDDLFFNPHGYVRLARP